MIVEISKEDVCNLSRIPLGLTNNPILHEAWHIHEGLSSGSRGLSLDEFRRQFSPKTLADLFCTGPNIRTLQLVPANRIFLPWIHTHPVEVSDLRDTAFFCMSDHDINQKEEKIRALVHSFVHNGYSPKDHCDRRGGYPTGYWLIGRDCHPRRFYVVSGNHRVATYFSLFPKKKMRVLYENKKFMKPRDLYNCGFVDQDNHPTEFYLDDVSNWPSVQSGFLTDEEAIHITNRFLEA